MKVRAKFRVGQVSDVKQNVYTGELDEKGHGIYENRDCKNIKLYVVGGDTPENKQFFASTPSGTIDLSIVNPAASDQLVLGKEFYVDFTEVE